MCMDAWVDGCTKSTCIQRPALPTVVLLVEREVEKERHKTKTWFYCGKAIPTLAIDEN